MEVTKKLPPHVSLKGERSFLRHIKFYKRFIKDFSKVTKSMCKLLEKKVEFEFGAECLRIFKDLKKKLMEAPILISPDWELPFECDV